MQVPWVLMGMPLSAQEVLENLKDRWYQADNPPSDLLLTEDEFLSFLHPEHSRGMLKFMVKEIVRDLGEAWPVTKPLGGGASLLAAGLEGRAHCAPAAVLLAGVGLGVLEAVQPHSGVVREGQTVSWAIWPPPGSRAGQVR